MMQNFTRENTENMTQLENHFSICPAGEKFPLPAEDDYAEEFKKIRKLVDQQRQKGREIVVVMGVGFVGSVMAGVVADAIDPDTGAPTKFVIGMQRPYAVFLEDSLFEPRHCAGGGRGSGSCAFNPTLC